MNLISNYLISSKSTQSALNKLHLFDIEDFEASIILRLPLEILQDQKLTNYIVRSMINERVQKLAVDAILEAKEYHNQVEWDEVD